MWPTVARAALGSGREVLHERRQPGAPGAQTAGPRVGGGPDYEALLSSPSNLVRNPSFEAGDAIPDGWFGGAASEHPAAAVMGLVEPGLFGKRCARIRLPHGAPSTWLGWRQDVRVEPRKSYLFAAWLKCEDLQGGLQLHAHFRNAAGELCEKAQMTGAGPAITGTTDWSLVSGLFTMPEDIAHFQLHLTMNATGTAWHDGAVLVEVSAGQVGRLQTRASAVDQGVQVWPVNAIVKVFQDDAAAARCTARSHQHGAQRSRTTAACAPLGSRDQVGARAGGRAAQCSWRDTWRHPGRRC